jgi:4-amino-4-deoxy-L-arabinose transferase-like glycosyltransferase
MSRTAAVGAPRWQAAPVAVDPPVGRSVLPRGHLVVLALLIAAGAARGLYWVSVIEVWRGDEAQHYSYVEQLATGGGLPVLGVDHVSDEATLVYRRSATNGYAATDFPPIGSDPRWGAPAEQYEAGQGPSYYALLALPFRLAAGWDVGARLFLLRAVSLLLLLTALPLTWLLARAVVPGRPAAWLLAPALLGSWQGFNVAGSGLSNDALVTPLALAALTAAAWAYRRGPTLPLAAAAGTALGLAVLTKPSALVLALPTAAFAVAAALRHRPRPLRALAWLALAGATAAAPVLPWLAWQRATYAPSSVTVEFNRLLGEIIGQYPWGRDTALFYLRSALQSLFNHGDFRPRWEPYSLGLLGVVALAAVAGIVAGCVRHRRDEALGIGVLASAFPLGFATMAALVVLALDGYGSIAGRYLGPALPAGAVVIACGALLALGRRAGVAAVLVVIAVALTAEVEHDHTYVRTLYLRGLPVEGSAPAIVQDQGGAFLADPVVRVDSPCPTTAVGLAFLGSVPTAVEVRSGGRVVRAPRIAAEPLAAGTALASYRVDASGAFEVAVTAPQVAVSRRDREPRLALAGAPGDPVARVSCPAEDPEAVRFAQLHGPFHPDLPLGWVLGWPRAWAAAGRVAAVLAAAWALSGLRRRG